MSLPTAVFLDTSVLAGQQYNYSSTAISSFVQVAKDRKLPLLLPDPTRREVLRQIRERSSDALKALEEARRRAPFLTKWRSFPKLPDARLGDWEVRRLAISEWDSFLKQFEVVNLGYEGVDIAQVMNWYDAARAPFAHGKKRKEFPDALAIAALATFASKTSKYIAVVSEDQDFRAACEHFPYLLYFPSLPSLTELLLADNTTIEVVREQIKKEEDKLEKAVAREAEGLSFYHENPRYLEIEDVEIEGFIVDDVRVVGLGDREATVTFEGELSFNVRLQLPDLEDDYGRNRESASVSDFSEIRGTAKLRFKPDKSGIDQVVYVEIDGDEIEVTEEP